MKPEQAAYVNLVALARADQHLSQDELSLLEEYREVLGVSKEFAEEIEQTANLHVVFPKELNGRPADRLQIVKMMIRVSYADGTVDVSEKRLLKKVARSLGVGPIALSGLFWEIEKELGIRRRLRISQIVAGSMLIVAAVAIWIIIAHLDSETSEQIDAARLDFDRLKEELGLERARAEEALRRVRQTQEDLKKDEDDLSRNLKELEKKSAVERNALKTALTTEHDRQRKSMQTEIKRLRAELARVRNLNAAFKEIEKEYGSSILLILTTYDLVLGNDRIKQGSMGTGFFVSPSGHIVTNKHVVQPWKFDADQIMLLDRGFSVDTSSIFIAAWPAGADVKTAAGALDIDSAYSTADGRLRLDKTTADTFVEQTRPLQSGGFYTGRFHTANRGDLALLEATLNDPALVLPLEPDLTKLEKLDAVMVLGFPTGISILESTKAETSPSLGEIRKIESSIMVTAPIVGGNSGGPLIDFRGKVVGVASANFGEATLGSCIPARHVVPLLPPVEKMMERIVIFEAGERFRAALDSLRLADQRSSKDSVRETIAETRSRILEIRDEMIGDAKKNEDREKQKEACRTIVDRFGPHWGAEALELLGRN